MLAEQGLPVPPVDPSDGERYAYLVRAFGLGVIGLADFSGEFYSHLPAWDDQSLMEQRVVVLLDAWERKQDEEGRTALVTDMRAAVRGKRG